MSPRPVTKYASQVKRKLVEHAAPIVRDIVINCLINGRGTPRRVRGLLLNIAGHDIHPSAVLSPDVFLGSAQGLKIGAHSFMNYGCFLDLCAPVSIGTRTSIGYQVMLITGSHEIGSARSRTGTLQPKPITIGNGVWIGARATVLPGVSINDGCVIAAGAVVTGDCAADGLYAGVPARRVRDLPQGDRELRIDKSRAVTAAAFHNAEIVNIGIHEKED